MVRAKFKVSRVVPHGEGVRQVFFDPVIDGSEENKSFWQFTPSGQIMLWITNPAAFEQFEVGKEHYVDFTRAE